MLRNLLHVALRGMRRHWSYTLLNVFGLSIGLVTAFLILLWVRDEKAYNLHYPEADSIYRVMRNSNYGEGQNFTWPAITAKLDDVLDEEFAEIELAALFSWEQNMAFRRGEVLFRENGLHAGPDWFRILGHDFLAGDPRTALQYPESLVLSEKMARKYFPEAFTPGTLAEAAATDILGETVNLENRLDLVVTGVYRDLPAQSTYRPDYVLPVEEFARRNAWVDDWGNNGLRMVVKLTPGADGEQVSESIRMLIQQNTASDSDFLFLQPWKDIYLKNSFENGVLVGGRIDYLRIFTLVAVFVLLIAAINFTNLSTARAAQRTREVGVRKTFGSGRWPLAAQFAGESVALAAVALVVALIAVLALLPWFNGITGKEIALSEIGPAVWLQFVAIALGTGMVAGWYPALHLSSFPVMRVLRHNDHSAGGGVNLRRALVVFQFAMSVLLVIGAGAVSTQLDFIRSKNLGLDRQDVFYSVLGGAMQEQFDTFRQQALADPSVESVSMASSLPLAVGSSTSGGVRWEAKDPDDNTLFSILTVGFDFVETMRMEMAAGRDFSREFGADSLNIVVNEQAAEAMGFENPIGETVTVWGRTGQIVGVVRDFHFTSLYDEIDPLVMRLEPDFSSWVFVRPSAGQTEQALAHFSALFGVLNPEMPLETSFLDDQFERTYRSEAVIQSLARGFTLLAIIVACLGLFGLAAFSAARRTKEIGVRKVLGASVAGIVALLSREFVALVGIAFLIALPVAWFAVNRWLEQFAYRASLGWSLFGLTAVGLIALAFLTVSVQAVKAARLDPARSLRND